MAAAIVVSLAAATPGSAAAEGTAGTELRRIEGAAGTADTGALRRDLDRIRRETAGDSGPRAAEQRATIDRLERQIGEDIAPRTPGRDRPRFQRRSRIIDKSPPLIETPEGFPGLD